MPKFHRRVMVFDTETSGLMPKHKFGTAFPPMEAYPHIMQISWIVYNVSSNVIEEVVDEYVQIPDTAEISPESIQVHGITREIAKEKGKPIAPLLAKFFLAYMKCDCIVAHNLQFDSELVRKEMWRNKKELERVVPSKERVNMMCGVFTKKFNAAYYIDTFCTMMNTIQFCGIEFVAKPKPLPDLGKIVDSSDAVELREPVVELTGLKEPVVELKEPVVELKEPVAELREPAVELKEPAVELKEPEVGPMGLEEPVVELKEPAVGPKEPEVGPMGLKEPEVGPMGLEEPAVGPPPATSRKKFPRLNELYAKLFDTPLPADMHNSIVDVLVCLRCFLKVRGAKEMSEDDFLELVKTHSRG